MAKGSTLAANHIQGRAKCSSIFQVIAGTVLMGGSFSGQVYNWLNFSKKYEIDWSKLSRIQLTRHQTITIDQMNLIKSVSFQKKKESRKKDQLSFW